MEIKIGSILWAAVPDKNGYVKDRPLVVIGVSDHPTSPLICCCITTTQKSPRPPTYVPVPWDRTGRSSTGLREPSFAVANWVVEVPRNKCRRVSGRLPAKRLNHLLDVIAAIRAQPEAK